MTQVKPYKIYSPLAIRERALDYAGRPEPQEVSKGRKGACIGNLTDAVKQALGLAFDIEGNKVKLTKAQKEKVEGTTRLVVSWLFMDETETFSPTSRGELTPQQVNALGRWSSEYKNNEWVQRRTFIDELTWIIYWANRAWQLTTHHLSIGEDIPFSDVLAAYHKDTTMGENAPDYWNLQTLSEKNAPKVQSDDIQPPEGAVWCEWCEDVITPPGIPCPQCQILGAKPGDNNQIPLSGDENKPPIPDSEKQPETASGDTGAAKIETNAFAGLP